MHPSKVNGLECLHIYPRPLCNLIINSLYPHVVNLEVFSMPCVALLGKKQQHRQKLVKGYPSVPLDVMMAETGCSGLGTPAFVHKFLDRAEWKGHPEALKAIENEKQGLLANGTWDESKIRPKSEVLAMARASGTKIHIGSLMVIVSIEGYEKPSSEWIVKARIVFVAMRFETRRIKQPSLMKSLPPLQQVLVDSIS